MAILNNNGIRLASSITEAGGGGDGYQIEKSLRFNEADSSYLTHTPSSAGNRRIWTFSAWIKRNKLQSAQVIFSAGTVAGSGDPQAHIAFDADDKLVFAVGEGTGEFESDARFRDPGAWLHVVCAFNSTKNYLRSADTIKMWVNGKALTAGSYAYGSNSFRPDINNAILHAIGSRTSSAPSMEADFQIAEAFFISGRSLCPAAFGEYDSNGNWNPKNTYNEDGEFIFPAPNNNTTWSAGSVSGQALTNGSGGSGGSEDWPQVFDIDGYPDSFTAGVVHKSSSVHHYTFTNKLPAGIYRLYGAYNGTGVRSHVLTGDDDTEYVFKLSSSAGWSTEIYIPQEVKKASLIDYSNSSGTSIRHIEVDGVLLADGYTDLSSPDDPNKGNKWSDSVSNEINNAMWSGEEFGGTYANNNQTTSVDLTDFGGITYTKSIRARFTKTYDTSGLTLIINGTDVTSNLRTNAANDETGSWYDISSWFSGDTLNTASWDQGSAGNKYIMCECIEVDGYMLTDEIVDNSFHLKFNDTSRNSALGKDTLNGKIDDATGGLPIYNTSDDYGEVKDSGYAADSNAAALKLAIPGDVLTDEHDHVTNATGSAVAVTANGSIAVSTDQSRFYGSSIRFDGSDDNLTISSPPFTISDRSTTYTVEGWIWTDNSVFSDDTYRSIFQAGDFGIGFWRSGHADGKKIYVEGDSSGSTWPATLYSSAVISSETWYHIAFVRNGTSLKLFLNGALQQEVTTSGTDSAESAWIMGATDSVSARWKGYQSDFKVYDTAIYSSNFKPPTRNDFKVNNITANIDATNTGEITAKSTATTTLDYGISFVSGSDESLSRSWGSGQTNNAAWCFATWFKTTATEDYFLCAGATNQSGGNHSMMRFEDADTFQMYNSESSSVYGAWSIKWDISDLSLQDGNWHHILVNGHSANSNSKHRIQVYFDGVQRGFEQEAGGVISGEFDPPDQNDAIGYWNNNHTHTLGDQTYENKTTNIKFAETYFVDGNKYNPSPTFLQADGRPQPTGTPNSTLNGLYGNKGFYLKYDDSAALGDDESGNTNDWTLVGSPDQLTSGLPSGSIDTLTLDSSDKFGDLTTETTYNQSDSNAAGELYTIDSGNKQLVFKTSSGSWSANTGKTITIPAVGGGDTFTDSPTNYGTDTGVGGEVRGNYCTLNPIDMDSDIALSQGNLRADISDNSKMIRGTVGVKGSGKWYFEVECEACTNDNNKQIGVHPLDIAKESYIGSLKSVGYHKDGRTLYNGEQQGTTGSTWGTDDVIGVALDLSGGGTTNGKVTFYKNGTAQTGQILTTLDCTKYYTIAVARSSLGSGNSIFNVNAGQSAFKYTAPAGHKCLCTQNLSNTFSGDELNNPSKYFDITTYTGTGAEQDIEGLGFQPDLVFLKERSDAANWQVYDAVRGATKVLECNDGFDIETTVAQGLKSFDADGFTLGTEDASNTNTETYVAHVWDAGTAASGANNDGSVNIASGDQWKNTTAGFSITKFTPPGSGNYSVGHGLAAKPEFVITKNLEDNGGYYWNVYHKSLGIGKVIVLNDTAAADTDAAYFPSEPTNTLFNLGTKGQIAQTDDYIMYAWTSIPGYSVFGKYTGNDSADGPFVYTGMSPKWIMIKNADQGSSAADWLIYDTERSTFNAVDDQLYPNRDDDEAAESTHAFDILSNGFKVRSSSTSDLTNSSGDDFIYAAFAEFPFKLSRAH